MSSDSSDDEDLDKLREAADSQFINDSMFNKKQDKTKQEPLIEKPQSLRRSKDDDEQFNLFRVSAEFRNYIAKQLSAKLDKVLDKELSEINTNCEAFNTSKRRKSGIKLFRDSPYFIKLKNKSVERAVRKKPVDSDEDEDFEKFKSVAVNPEDVLSKKETLMWSNRSKAPVYEYIQSRNGFIHK